MHDQERDACGIGFVADARGRESRAIVESALDALCRVRHRGAVAADALTGDGAGVLLPLPHAILGSKEPDRTGVAMVFLDPSDAPAGRKAVEDACLEEGLELLSWRQVPIDGSAIGDSARATLPQIEQAIVRRPLGSDITDGEKRAFRARKRAERHPGLYLPSFSFRTITYKALCAADQLASFYTDLADDRYVGWFALFHQRYSTNTTPTWDRAQPFRFLAHNGEINTIRGNVALMRAREGRLGADDLAPEDLLRPVVDVTSSDSGILDQALELLVRGGRELAHAAAMLVPPAWEGILDVANSDRLDDRDGYREMPEEVRDFLHFHSCLLEPWDGPAALVFADGEHVAATLDRNGLRPLRVAICEDGLVACGSEAGSVNTRGHGRVRRTNLGPGQTLVVDPARGGVLEDDTIKRRLAARRPYGDWLAENLRESSPGVPLDAPGPDVLARQVAAGYAKEEFTVVVRPMATDGHEPTSSMGDDTAQPPLAGTNRGVFSFLKQRFAQVTNPPIDHLRERHVMSLTTRLGPRDSLLAERPRAAAQREFRSFLLFPSALETLDATWLDATFEEDLRDALLALGDSAAEAVRAGADVLIVSDRGWSPDRIAIPASLAAGVVHHRLLAEGLRSQTSLVVDSIEPRESHHAACLLTNGADAICPRLALESITELAIAGRLGGEVPADQGQLNFFSAIEDGLLKIMSKMGISTLDSYRGAQIIEAIGLGPDVIELCFTGIESVLGGLSLDDLEAQIIERHADALAAKPILATTGYIKFKRGGEYHAFNPDVIDALAETVGVKPEMQAAHALQRAVKGDDEAYRKFAALVDERPPTEPRDLLDLVPSGTPVPLEEVEPAGSIAKRFSTGAMSHGALSAEAHETLSVALNMIGGMANTGEGGEAPERYRDERNSGIKQIASGRFGVTPEYISFARELQIKMAQGSKPGEGGQLPGKKVTDEIARLRHTVPGVALISPPPHHDIYSIEDLAQLIFDLKQANPTAAVSVKLVSSEGVGTIAAGVVKGLADVVHIAGADGGTGASPLSSIKNAGMPWETGLVETQAALVSNGLRGRTKVRVDGGLKTGRDIVIAALLGADEYSFGTAALVAEGCILVRTCHRDTCPVGIATQNPELRAKFAGTPEMVARYLMLVAEDVRLLLSSLGLRTLEEAIGRSDLLRAKESRHPRRAGEQNGGDLDMTPLLVDPGPGERSFTGTLDIQRPRSDLGDRLFDAAMAGSTDLRYPISTADRTVGARLGCAFARDGGHPVVATFEGEAGQSFGAFLSDGIELRLVGEANDYVCKGMGGGRVVIIPPANDAGDPVLAGNTVLYGATGGQLFIAGRAGERFAVRNSGAVAVVEGTGDNACEYMTAGAVVVLGPTGRNVGAGMSGGEAYIYDLDETKLNTQLVAAYEPTDGQLASLQRVLQLHHESTVSPKAAAILADWKKASKHFSRIAPVAEVARLEALFEGTAVASTAE